MATAVLLLTRIPPDGLCGCEWFWRIWLQAPSRAKLQHGAAIERAGSVGQMKGWNGSSRYTQRVVGSGIKAQVENPEVRVKEADPVINQVIDKLKHINQLLQGRSIPKLGTLDLIETGSGDTEGPYSGDCDDEDGCWGSGSGPGGRRTAIGTTKQERRRGIRVWSFSPRLVPSLAFHGAPNAPAPPNTSSQDPPNSASFTARISACVLKRSGQIAQPHSL
ncbi:hypothetical protein MHYP_G00090000 [Metynnis hypsauchen]